MRLLILLASLGLIASFIVSHNSNVAYSQNIEEERYYDETTEEPIRDSDFCIVGKIRVTKMEVLKETNILDEDGNCVATVPISRTVEGVVEIDSVIYGDPKTKEIPFFAETGNTSWTVFGEADVGIVTESTLWGVLLPEEGDTFIILGKGTGKDITIIKTIRQYPSTSIKSRVECFRNIKHLQGLKEKEFQKQRDKLLAESNNIELLFYLFRQGLQEGGVDQALSIIETLLARGKVTPEQRFIGYGLAAHILDYHHIYKDVIPGHRKGLKRYAPARYQVFEAVKDITPVQHQALNDIIIKSLSGIKTIEEGIKYLRKLGSKILKEDTDLRDSLKVITDNLSQQFKEEKDYPEWAKWVKKIFLDKAPRGN